MTRHPYPFHPILLPRHFGSETKKQKQNQPLGLLPVIHDLSPAVISALGGLLLIVLVESGRMALYCVRWITEEGC